MKNTLNEVEILSEEQAAEILKEARELYGDKFIIQLLKEECLELALAIQKLYERGYTEKRYENLLEEICDVEIMIQHIKEIFPREKIAKYREFKLRRQIKRNQKRRDGGD